MNPYDFVIITHIYRDLIIIKGQLKMQVEDDSLPTVVRAHLSLALDKTIVSIEKLKIFMEKNKSHGLTQEENQTEQIINPI